MLGREMNSVCIYHQNIVNPAVQCSVLIHCTELPVWTSTVFIFPFYLAHMFGKGSNRVKKQLILFWGGRKIPLKTSLSVLRDPKYFKINTGNETFLISPVYVELCLCCLWYHLFKWNPSQNCSLNLRNVMSNYIIY